MPWVKEALCRGCAVCVSECPVDAIRMKEDGYAAIDDAECIRCGRCHDICPQEAVRHDKERIPQEVSENLRWVSKLLDHYQQPTEQSVFMERMVRHFKRQEKVAQETLAVIVTVGHDAVGGIETAIQSLSGQ